MLERAYPLGEEKEPLPPLPLLHLCLLLVCIALHVFSSCPPCRWLLEGLCAHARPRTRRRKQHTDPTECSQHTCNAATMVTPSVIYASMPFPCGTVDRPTRGNPRALKSLPAPRPHLRRALQRAISASCEPWRQGRLGSRAERARAIKSTMIRPLLPSFAAFLSRELGPERLAEVEAAAMADGASPGMQRGSKELAQALQR